MCLNLSDDGQTAGLNRLVTQVVDYFKRLRMKKSIIALAVMFAGSAVPIFAVAQEKTASEMVFAKETEDIQARVQRMKTTCSLTYFNKNQNTAVSIDNGNSVISSQITLVGAIEIGTNGGTFSLDRIVPTQAAPSKGTFSKSNLGQGAFAYRGPLNRLGIDFADVKDTYSFSLKHEDASSDKLRVSFSGDVRNEAVAAMQTCLDSLPSYWKLEK